MTDSIEVPGDPTTFDIAAVLMERAYPEIDVPFYLDENSALAISRAENELTELALLGKTEEHDMLEATIKELTEALRGARYVITLRGLSNKHRQDLLAESYVAFPKGKEAMFGVEQPNDEREQLFSNLLLHAMCVKIMNPAGAVQVHPPMETIEQFRGYAPLAAMDKVWDGVRELTEGVKAGFERAAQDVDFLSKP